MYLSFTHPVYLVFLFAIPLLIFLHFYSLKNIRGRALGFANYEAIARVKGIDLYSKNILLLVFDIIFLTLLVLALSGLTIHKEMAASSFSFVIAIDNSESMEATDLLPSRLEAAKVTAIDFVETLPFESYVGVVSFSGDSYTEQGLTKSKQELKYAIENVQIGEVGGTDIFEAVSSSGKLLKKENNKAVILLSDGQINTGKVDEAIDFANFNEILVHTIGVGTIEGGETSYGLSKLDEDSLKSLAYNTDGRYFNAQNKKELESSFKEIVGVTTKLGSINLTFYLIMAVIALFLLKQVLLSRSKIMW